MNTLPEERYRVLSRVCAWGAVLFGLTGLLGWVFDVPTLRTLWPGLAEMKANTGFCLTLTGLALALRLGTGRGKRFYHHSATVLASIVLAVGVLTTIEYARGVNFGIDEFLFADYKADRNGPLSPGRMAPAAAINFVLLGAALLLLGRSKGKGGARLPSALALTAGMLIVLAFVRYFYGVETYATVLPYVTIALHTVLAFALLCLGILFAQPDVGVMRFFSSTELTGLLLRRMIPAAVLVPLVLGWLAVKGERAGSFGVGFGTAFYTTLMIGAFVGVSVWVAGALAKAAARLEASEQNETARRREAETLLRRVESVREEERARLAREIHDVLAQELTRLKLDISWVKLRLAKLPSDGAVGLEQKLSSMSGMVDGTLSTVKRMATELRPMVLDTLGLAAAVEWQAKEFSERSGIKCFTKVEEEGLGLNKEEATAVFRIFQESLTNVVRHAKAHKVEVALRREGPQVVLAVADDGIGISEEALSNRGSLGLLGMRERALLLGGECTIRRGENAGTVVSVSLHAKAGAEDVSW